MFERILFRRSDLSRHRNGPYAKEREGYLTLLMEEGRALPTLYLNGHGKRIHLRWHSSVLCDYLCCVSSAS